MSLQCTTMPKISIVIPVYNVEPYLRQCLDSVVNQTMQDIQIICVNDGSPDNSRSILQEYADRDSRIEIIDKPNGGLSSARNAAYPQIKGKYTLFVDSDDWIELDLCEKTYHKAEETGAPVTVFFHHDEGDRDLSSMYYPITPGEKTTIEEKLSLLDYPTAWSKLWRTDFLLGNKLYFPEGLCFEDNLVHWQAVTLADKISVVPERLYHYRFRSGSIMLSSGKHNLHIVLIYNKIYDYLVQSGYYAVYRDNFISMKLHVLYYHYCTLPSSLKPKFAVMLYDSLTEDDRVFYRTAQKKLVPKVVQLFYKMIDGGSIETINYHYHIHARSMIRMPERLLRQWIIKPIKKRLKAA